MAEDGGVPGSMGFSRTKKAIDFVQTAALHAIRLNPCFAAPRARPRVPSLNGWVGAGFWAMKHLALRQENLWFQARRESKVFLLLLYEKKTLEKHTSAVTIRTPLAIIALSL